MKYICRHCGCENESDFLECAGKRLPKWLRKVDNSFPIPPSFAVCGCPCHWRGSHLEKEFITAYKEINGE